MALAVRSVLRVRLALRGRRVRRVPWARPETPARRAASVRPVHSVRRVLRGPRARRACAAPRVQSGPPVRPASALPVLRVRRGRSVPRPLVRRAPRVRLDLPARRGPRVPRPPVRRVLPAPRGPRVRRRRVRPVLSVRSVLRVRRRSALRAPRVLPVPRVRSVLRAHLVRRRSAARRRVRRGRWARSVLRVPLGLLALPARKACARSCRPRRTSVCAPGIPAPRGRSSRRCFRRRRRTALPARRSCGSSWTTSTGLRS